MLPPYGALVENKLLLSNIHLNIEKKFSHVHF